MAVNGSEENRRRLGERGRPDDPAGDPERAGGGDDDAAADGDGWQEARDRVLLYLKLLGVDAIGSLTLTLAALRRAQAAVPGEEAPVPPLALAMDALQDLLRDDPRLLENTPFAGYPALYRRWQREARPPDPCGAGPAAPGGMPVLPPIRRRSMKIKKF